MIPHFVFFKRLESIVKTKFAAAREALHGYDLRTGLCECILLDNDILGKWTQLTVATSISEHASLILFQLIANLGLVHVPELKDYWSTHPAYYNQLISQTMTRDRFFALSTHLRCADPKQSPDLYENREHRHLGKKPHPLYPIKEVWDTVVPCCQDKWNLARDLALDEAMVKYRGFQAWITKFFMPCKPIRQGFKMYAVAESLTGCLCNFMIHPVQEATVYMTTLLCRQWSPF